MKSCSNCKWSSKYFRGLLCHWVEKHNIRPLPEYLHVTGKGYAGLESSYPYMLDEQDFGDTCPVFGAVEHRVHPTAAGVPASADNSESGGG